MKATALALALAGALLASGCATTQGSPAAFVPWHDQAFGYEASLVRVSKDELFRLDPDVERMARLALRPSDPTAKRVDALMTTIMGADRKGFSYEAGHSTTASETWKRRSGDCLSLTVLTYAVARAAGLDAQMQEVRAPALVDRRSGVEYVNRHVNVAFAVQTRGAQEHVLYPRYIVIDFEPQYATGFRGRPLDDNGIAARYYNNIGAEFMAQGRTAEAYAHFKTAIATDASYAAPYGNLAALYRKRGLEPDAERLLRRAVELSVEPEVALQGLHQLLVDRGREAEARSVAERLREYQDSDPYYWIAQGLRHLGDSQPRRAVDALEHANSISSGFGEVHRLLAVAYFRLGDRKRADEQLALMSALDSGGVMTAKLKRKFNTSQ